MPGQNFIYAHLNRVIAAHDLDAIYISGPDHGGPAVLANVYLEGTYSEIYPSIMRDEAGLRRLFKQFSFPGGIPSHVAPETPGSIHEGGELGYALSHAFGAAFDNPDLLVACVVGDGEAETGPLATAWHANKFLNPATDGAVLPFLDLNGYKIANPPVLARIPREELAMLLRGYGWEPHFVEGDDPEVLQPLMAEMMDRVVEEIREIQREARECGDAERPRWPLIVLATPKGWMGPEEVDGVPVEGTFRSHQVPLAELAEKPEHLAALETWMRSYRPEELFDEDGRLRPELAAPARAERPRLRRALHQGPAGRLRLPRLPLADPPAHLPPHQPREPPRARLQGGGHHHHSLRHGRAQRPRPLPPRAGRDRPPAPARLARHLPPAGDSATCSLNTGRTSTSSARTSRRCASGGGSRHERPGAQRGQLQSQVPGARHG